MSMPIEFLIKPILHASRHIFCSQNTQMRACSLKSDSRFKKPPVSTPVATFGQLPAAAQRAELESIKPTKANRINSLRECHFHWPMANHLGLHCCSIQSSCNYWNPDWNRGHPDNVNQSQSRTETKDSNIFKSSQSNVGYRTMKSQLVCWPEMNMRQQNQLLF